LKTVTNLSMASHGVDNLRTVFSGQMKTESAVCYLSGIGPAPVESRIAPSAAQPLQSILGKGVSAVGGFAVPSDSLIEILWQTTTAGFVHIGEMALEFVQHRLT
jgi:hypothetical protein